MNPDKLDLAMEMGFADLRERVYFSVGGRRLYAYPDDVSLLHNFMQRRWRTNLPPYETQLEDVHRPATR